MDSRHLSLLGLVECVAFLGWQRRSRALRPFNIRFPQAATKTLCDSFAKGGN
jgi:hypothetical protein